MSFFVRETVHILTYLKIFSLFEWLLPQRQYTGNHRIRGGVIKSKYDTQFNNNNKDQMLITSLIHLTFSSLRLFNQLELSKEKKNDSE